MVLHTVYHVTTLDNAKNIIKYGFKPRKYVKKEVIGSTELFGGLENTNSFTYSKKIADDFALELKLMIETSKMIQNNQLTENNMCEYVNKTDKNKLITKKIKPCDIWEAIQNKSEKFPVGIDSMTEYYCYLYGMNSQFIQHDEEFKIYENERYRTKLISKQIANKIKEQMIEGYNRLAAQMPLQITLDEYLMKSNPERRYFCLDDKNRPFNKKQKLFSLYNEYMGYRNQISDIHNPLFINKNIDYFVNLTPDEVKIIESTVDIPFSEKELREEWKIFDQKDTGRYSSPSRFYKERNKEGVSVNYPKFQEIVIPTKNILSSKIL